MSPNFRPRIGPNLDQLGDSDADVLATTLTGYVSIPGYTTITSSDTVLSAIERLNGNIDSIIAGEVISVFGRTGVVVATNGDYNTSQVTELTNLYFTNSRAVGATLIGYVSGAGTISSSDSILSAIQKLNGNISALVTGVSSFNTRTGAITLTSGDVTTALGFTPVSGSGVTNQISYWIGTSTQGGDSTFIFNPTTKFFGLGGNPSALFHLQGNISAANWGSTGTATGIGLRMDAVTLTNTTSSGTIASIYGDYIGIKTFAASSATTYTLAGSVYIAGVAAGTNVTNTNTAALVLGGNLLFNAGSTMALGTYDQNILNIRTNNTTRINISSSGRLQYFGDALSSGTTSWLIFTEPSHTGGSNPGLQWISGTHTNQTASTERIDQEWRNNRTITWATGTLALQRAMVIGGQTLAFAAASTVTIACTLDVQMPVAGSNATITNNYAQRWVFDASNYLGITVGSTGIVDLKAIGSGAGFIFNTNVTSNGNIGTTTTLDAANFFVTANSSTTRSSTTNSLLFTGSTTNFFRTYFNGNINFLPTTNSYYSSIIVGGHPVTIASTGTHPIFANMLINPISITAGAGSLTNSATLYVNGAATGATNNYSLWVASGLFRIGGDTTRDEGVNLIFGTTTGSKIGTSTSQKIAFWNKTPVIQPTTGITGAAFVANTSGIINGTATYGGYTGGQIVAALQLVGILA